MHDTSCHRVHNKLIEGYPSMKEAMMHVDHMPAQSDPTVVVPSH